MNVALGLLAVLALTLGTGYFVAAEFSFVAARRGRLEELSEAGDKRADRALAVLPHLSFMLSGAQLGITVTTLIVGFIAEPTIGQAVRPLLDLVGVPESAIAGVSITLGFFIATTAGMVLGELAPKNLAIAEPDRFATALARSTYLYTKIASPIIRFFDSSSNALLKLFGIEPVEELSHAVSAEELEYIIGESSRGGSLDAKTATLLSRALDFRSLRAVDAMVPRVHVSSIDAEATGTALRDLTVETGHSRFPVTGNGLDDVVGVVQAQDLLRVAPAARNTTLIRTFLKPVLAVPESTPLGPLLGDMRRSHTQLAVVVDEHGGTAGIVTLEDIVEELVGNIQDEHDPAEPQVRRADDGSFAVPGSWRLDETARDTGISLPEGDYDTLGGLIMERLGRVAEAGDVVTTPVADLRVERMDGMAVSQVRMTPRGDGQ